MLSDTIVELLSQQHHSLADLQQQTQVSMPTLRRAVQDLVDNRWISTVGQSATSRGRPAMLYGLDDSTHCIVGVHLQLPGLRLVTVDLPGNVLDEINIDHYDTLSPEDVLLEIAEYVQSIEQTLPHRNLLGIGIAAPGFTDPQSGEIISIGRVPTWQNFPIQARITATLGLPTFIANDIDCLFGNCRSSPCADFD